MRALLLCIGALVCFELIGCSGGPKLVGTWEAEGIGPNGIKGTRITFNANSTYSVETNLLGRRVTTSGTYTFEGERLTMTPRKISGLSEKFQKLNEKRLAENPNSETSTLEWKSGTEIVMVSSTGRSLLRKLAS